MIFRTHTCHFHSYLQKESHSNPMEYRHASGQKKDLHGACRTNIYLSVFMHLFHFARILRQFGETNFLIKIWLLLHLHTMLPLKFL
jgi:hypothetical protein